MANETPQMELELLQRRAKASGHYVNRHQWWDPTRGNGDLYMSRAKRVRTDPAEPWLMRYATATAIHARLTKIEREAEYERQHQDQ